MQWLGEMKEKQAIKQLRDGELSGLETLVNNHQATAVQAAFLIVGDRASAEDIVADAFLKSAAKIHQFDDDRPFRPWFMRIVINDAKDILYRSRKNPSLEEFEEDNLTPEFLQDDSLAPEAQAIRAEERRRVWRALEQLSPNHRGAIVAHYFLDMSNNEVSEYLDRTLGSIKWSLHIGTKRLKAIFSSEATDGRTSPDQVEG